MKRKWYTVTTTDENGVESDITLQAAIIFLLIILFMSLACNIIQNNIIKENSVTIDHLIK